MTRRSLASGAVALAAAWSVGSAFLYPAPALGAPIPVELRKTEAGWQLLRGGEPYFIRGAGGEASLEALAAAGANSVRTWGGEVGDLLDEAQALGLTVTVGIWLGHERHGFDYGDPEQVEAQLEMAREMVLRYRDHPALLLWGIGNEMEGFDQGDNPAVWEAVNDVAALVKSLDPHHPTMTVTAFVHGERIDYVHRRCPDIDIHGVNAYGGARIVPELLRSGGATKPYVLTEFGPPGPWETPKTSWGAPLEPTSNEKAAVYAASYRDGVLAAPGLALGSYAFLWGHKMEGTDTWFGMFLEDGAPTAAIDTMTELWSGEPPRDRSPSVAPLRIEGGAERAPGEKVEVEAVVRDPEGAPARTRWVLRPESGDYNTGGDYRRVPPEIEGAIVESGADSAVVRLPEAPGPYRLFLYAYDSAGRAATANLPLLVKGERRTPMPFPVYEDSLENMPWVPSGWMGGIDELSLDGEWQPNPFEGRGSIRLRYEGLFGWAGVAWQNQPGNWGDQDGGYDLRGARALELWARGEYGGEKVSFGVGLLGEDRAFPDSAITRVEDIVLTAEWQQYVVPLGGLDLSSIKTGFVVVLTGRRTPVTIYLDAIRYVR